MRKAALVIAIVLVAGVCTLSGWAEQVATDDLGLPYVYTDWETFTTESTDGGLPNDHIFYVRPDGDRVWVGTEHGLGLYENGKWKNWQQEMSTSAADAKQAHPVTRPRPGHADLPGCLKFNHRDARNILERASARETAIRVAVGAVCKALLRSFSITIFSYVISIGGHELEPEIFSQDDKQLSMLAENSPFRVPDPRLEEKLKETVDKAKHDGDSLGGRFRVIARGLPPGIGSHIQYDSKLDGRLAQALMSIQAIKGVEIGLGFKAAQTPGSRVHDEISYEQNRGFYHLSNNAGGIEGGISNGEDIVITAAMKPIPTLYRPLQSVDLISKQPFQASVERSDTCAVPAAAVVGEAAVAIEIARLLLEKFGGDFIAETMAHYQNYLEHLRSF